MRSEEFAHKFHGKLKCGNVIEVYFREPDIDGQKTRKLYYLLSDGFVPNARIGPYIWVSETLKENNHSKHRLTLDGVDNIILYKPLE